MRPAPATWLVAVSAVLIPAGPVPAQAQDTTGPEAYRRAVRQAATQARERIRRQGRVFLDTSISVSRRLAAVEDVSELMAPEQVARAKELVFDRGTPTPIRTRSLALTRTELTTDREYLDRVLGLMTSREVDRAVRRAAADAVRSMLMSISYLTARDDPARSGIRSAFGALLDAEDPALRRRAFAVLGGRGDSLAVHRLARGLRSPEEVPFEVAGILRLVGPFLPASSLPAVDSIMRDAPDLRTRIEAVRLLGGHEGSRETLYRYLGDPQAPVELRLAAAKALEPATTDRFLEEATALVRNADAPIDLRVYAIEAVRQRRLTGDASTLTRAPDPFDRAVLSVAESADSDTLRAVARRYVRTTYLSPRR